MSEPTYPSSFEGLMALVAHLRGPDGCPWDREQTRASMRNYVREESHELLDAIDEDDASKVAEELGDVLFHAAFQLRLAADGGEFGEEDVFGGVIEKLVRRHPHVFGDVDVRGAADVLPRWYDIKRQERSDEGGLRSRRRAEVAARAGARSNNPAARRASRVRLGRPGRRPAEGPRGDRRAARGRRPRPGRGRAGRPAVLARQCLPLLETDAETALRESSDRFRRRFRHMERASAERGVDFEALTLDQKEALWQEAKRSVDVDPDESGRRSF